MDDAIFLLGFVLGFLVSGVVRISIGRFVIYTSERGWVWQWSRFDEEDQRIIDRVNRAIDLGAKQERYDQQIKSSQKGKQ